MKLSDWMQTAGITDEELARRVGKDRVTISRVRRGKNFPSWELAAQLRRVTDGKVGPEDFLEAQQ